MTIRRSALLLLAGIAPLGPAVGQSAPGAGVLPRYDLEGRPAWRTELPVDLAEISGIAFAPDGELLAHGDEQGLIWTIDLKTRRPEGRFGLAGPTGVLRADFEDMEIVGDRLFLVTSSAEIYESRIVRAGTTTEARRRTQGLGDGCEVEGMGWDSTSSALLLLCKSTRSKRWKDHVVVLAVSPVTWRFEPRPRLLIPEKRLAEVTGEKRFGGSAIARHPRSGTYLLLAGPQRAYAEIGPGSEVLGGGRLDRSRHRQPEGIAIAPDLTLLISDEAAGKDATLTAYAYRP